MRAAPLLCCISLLFTPTGGLSQQVKPTYAELVTSARAALVAGDSEAAVNYSKAAITLDTEKWEAYAVAGAALIVKGHCADAIDFLTDAVARAPEERRASLKELSRPCVKLSSVESLKPDVAPVSGNSEESATPTYDTLLQASRQALASGDATAATAAANKAIVIDPKRWEAYAAAGTALALQKHCDRAFEYLTEAASRAPQEPRKNLKELLKQCLSDSTPLQTQVSKQNTSDVLPPGSLWERPTSSSSDGTSTPSPTLSQTAAAVTPTPSNSDSAPAASAEQLFWKAIEQSTNPTDYRAYLERYPNGVYAVLARARLEQFEVSSAKERAQKDIEVKGRSWSGLWNPNGSTSKWAMTPSRPQHVRITFDESGSCSGEWWFYRFGECSWHQSSNKITANLKVLGAVNAFGFWHGACEAGITATVSSSQEINGTMTICNHAEALVLKNR